MRIELLAAVLVVGSGAVSLVPANRADAPEPVEVMEWVTLPIGVPVVVPSPECAWWWRPYLTNRRVTNATDG